MQFATNRPIFPQYIIFLHALTYSHRNYGQFSRNQLTILYFKTTHSNIEKRNRRGVRKLFSKLVNK